MDAAPATTNGSKRNTQKDDDLFDKQQLEIAEAEERLEKALIEKEKVNIDPGETRFLSFRESPRA
jgi:dihydropteroate synthase